VDCTGEIARIDPELSEAIALELERERTKINLIASENYASPAVLQAQGSVLTNKYAEGYPDRRYYSGCGPTDLTESLAIARAKSLFGAEHANVQPHSGSQANIAVYLTVLEPGDTLMAMDLTCGGHLTHGAPFNLSGMLYRTVSYGVDRSSYLLDYDEIAQIARREKPKLLIAGGSSYPRTIDFETMGRIASDAGAALMVDMAHFAGLVAGGVHPDPVPHADFVTSTTHKTLRGARGGFILCGGESKGRIDAAVFPGLQGGPLMHAVAAKAVCFKEAMEPEFREYQQRVVENSRVLCEKMASEGFDIISGGTETHLFLVDLRPFGMTGHEAQVLLESVDINLNKNEIPYDETPAAVTSGVRLGTPAVTTRGMGPSEMEAIGGLVSSVLKRPGDTSVQSRVRGEVRSLADAFPVYPGLT